MAFQCEGCGDQHMGRDPKSWLIYKVEENIIKLVFCPTLDIDYNSHLCLENTITLLINRLPKEQKRLIKNIRILHEMDEYDCGGKSFSGIDELSAELFFREYDKKATLHRINANRLAQGDYLKSSPWIYGRMEVQPDVIETRAIRIVK